MTTFPITYIELIIWLIFISYEDIDYWTRFLIKLFGDLLGIEIAINAIGAGEAWLNIDSSLNFTITHFNDGFALPLSLFVLGTSILIGYNLAMSVISGDFRKPSAIHAKGLDDYEK